MKVLAFFSLVLAVASSYPTVKTWTLESLSDAIQYSTEEPGMRPYLQDAFDAIMLSLHADDGKNSVEVAIPAVDISTWSRSDLMIALSSPTTNPELIPYLEKAYCERREALAKGEARRVIYIVTPVGLVPPKADYKFLVKPSKTLIKKTKKGLQDKCLTELKQLTLKTL